MAIPFRLLDSGSRAVHSTEDLEQETYIGISMPLRNSEMTGSLGYFESTNYTVDAIRENIKNILSTHKQERIFRPSIGVAWNRFLFRQLTPELNDEMRQEISSAILTWMPFLKVQKVEIVRDETTPDNFIFVRLVIIYDNEILPMIYKVPTVSNNEQEY